MGPGLLRHSPVRLAPRTGFALSLANERAVIRGGYGIFLNQWAYSVQTAFARNPPFFFTREVDVPVDTRVPLYQTRDILTADPTRCRQSDDHGPRLRCRIHADLERRRAVRARSADAGGSELHGIVDRGCRQRDGAERTRAWRRSYSGAPTDSRAWRDPSDQV
jgi:hypothetical protein